MNYRKAHVVSLIIMFLGLAVALIFPKESSYEIRLVGAIVTIAIIAAGVIIRFAFCRCPNCRRFLVMRFFSLPDYCPRCGEPL